MQAQAVQAFREMLDSFVFFHLGSDAVVRVEPDGEALRVCVEHGRVRPFEFLIEAAQLEAMAADPSVFEDLMLGHLVRRRRA